MGSNTKQTKTSYPGVYRAKRQDNTEYFRASFYYRNKHISLGSFDNPDDAHRAYLSATLLVATDVIGINEYTGREILPFEKWVVIVNFRDNGIYFPNPIYIRKKYFSYYLSPIIELKFSIDDLFYYASHKIMKRGNHLFVADYGMQLSLVSRYGIKPYSVIDRDYKHINGDNYDYRYENIVVMNNYHRMSYTTHYGKPVYKTVIHVVSNYVVGYYPTALDAAIAYNKAIDILTANGFDRAFMTNYIDSIPASMYAEIYSRVSISDRITALRNQ